jgi:hypothetical protein
VLLLGPRPSSQTADASMSTTSGSLRR